VRLNASAGGTRAAVALASVGLLALAPAWAARPFVTDDADIIAPEACELELVHATQHQRAAPDERNSSAQLACGIGLNTEFGASGARATRGDEHWPVVALVGKTGLRRVADGELGLAVAYSLLGEKLPGAAFKQTRAAAALVATETQGRVLFHGNLGFVRDRIARNTTTLWALAVERIGERFDFGGELFGESTRSAWLGAGGRYAVLPNRLSVDTSYAMRGNSTRARRATLGMVLAF